MRRELGEAMVLVPEAATMLFAGGFPRYDEPDARMAAQLAIFHVQRRLEDVQAARYPGRVLLCDRGTVDGAAYWPGGAGGFFAAAGTSLDRELVQYDGVLFFESAAVGGLSVEGGNVQRREGVTEAALLDGALREVWSQHPNFRLIPHRQSFLDKIVDGVTALKAMLEALDGHLPGAPPPEASATAPARSR
jgi:hypothetical protein